MMAYYPPVGFHFKVTFGLSSVGEHDFRFQEVSGIGMELETITHREGGQNRFVHKLPSRTSHDPLVLKRGLLTDSAVISWCRKAIEELDISPVNIQVTLLNEQHEPLQAYNFFNAWPLKWSVSGFNAEESRLVIESMEFNYQSFSIG